MSNGLYTKEDLFSELDQKFSPTQAQSSITGLAQPPSSIHSPTTYSKEDLFSELDTKFKPIAPEPVTVPEQPGMGDVKQFETTMPEYKPEEPFSGDDDYKTAKSLLVLPKDIRNNALARMPEERRQAVQLKVDELETASPTFGGITKAVGAVTKQLGKELFPYSDPYKSKYWQKQFAKNEEELKTFAQELKEGKHDPGDTPASSILKSRYSNFLDDVKRWEVNPEKQERVRKKGQEIIQIGEVLDPFEYKKYNIEQRLDDLRKEDSATFAALKRGDLGFVISQAIGDAVIAGDEEKAKEAIELKKQHDETYKINMEDRKGLKKLYISTLEMLAPMVRTGAKMAVPVVGKAWSGYEWAKQGTGDVYKELIESGVSHETAVKIAPITGVIYAGIEQIKVGQLANIGQKISKELAGKSIKKTIIKLAKEKGKDYLKEIREEGYQRIITDIGAEMGKQIDGVSEKDMVEIIRSIIKGALKEMAKAAGPMGVYSVLGLGAGVVSQAMKGEVGAEKVRTDQEVLPEKREAGEGIQEVGGDDVQQIQEAKRPEAPPVEKEEIKPEVEEQLKPLGKTKEEKREEHKNIKERREEIKGKIADLKEENASSYEIFKLEQEDKKLLRKQKKVSDAGEVKVKRELNQIDRYAKSGEADTKLTDKIDTKMQDVIDKFREIGVTDFNNILKDDYTEEQLNYAIESIENGQKDGKAAEDIRKEVGEYLVYGTSPEQTKDMAETKPEDFLFGIEAKEEKPVEKEISEEEKFVTETRPKIIEKQKEVAEAKKEEVSKPAGIELDTEKEKPKRKEIAKPDEKPKVEGAAPLKETKEFKKSFDEVKKYVPKELFDKIDIVSDSMPKGENGKVDKVGDRLKLTIRKDIAPKEVGKVLFHEVAGHIGASNVFKSNERVYKRLQTLYNSTRSNKFKAELRKTYKQEIESNKAQKEDDIVFSEWVAYNVGEYLNKPTRKDVPYRVYNAVKDFLINIGIKKDTVDDAIRGLVDEMPRLKKVEAIKDYPAKMKEMEIPKEEKVEKSKVFDEQGELTEAAFDLFTRKAQDRFVRLERVQKELAPKGVSEEQDAYLKQELIHGKTESKLNEFEEKLFKPLRKNIARSKIDQAKLEDYLYAKFAPERNKHIKSIRPGEAEGFLTEKEQDLLDKAFEYGGQKAEVQNQLRTNSIGQEAAKKKISRLDKMIDNVSKEINKTISDKSKAIYTVAGSGMFDNAADKESMIELYSNLGDSEMVEHVKKMPVSSEIITAAKESGEVEKLEELSKQVLDINSRARNQLLEGGLIDEETKKSWEKYKNYVPLKGVDEIDKTPRVGKGFDIRGAESKRALGRKTKARNILANTVVQMNEAIIRAEKNKVGQTFLNFVRANPNDKLWEINKVERKPVFNKSKGEVRYETREIRMYKDPKTGEMIAPMSVKENGQEYHITIKDFPLARAMLNVGAQKQNAIVQVLGNFSRFFSIINTQFVPGFVFSNLTRDLQTAAINITSEKSSKLAAKITKDALVHGIRGVSRGLRGLDGEWANWYKEFEQAGGKIGFFGLKTVDDIQKDITKSLKELKPGNKTKYLKFYKNVGNFISHINESVENGVRLSTYVNMRKAGLTKARAASAAKNITVNFNKKGEFGSTMNALYVFSNAGIQGPARLMKALKTPKGKILAGSIIAGSVGIAQLSRFLGGQDDDGEDYYDKIPNWVKENNLIIMRPNSGGKYIKIPVPYGYNVFHAVGQAIDKVAHNKDSHLEGAAMVGSAIAGAFNPLGGEFGLTPRKLIKSAAPTVVKPIAELGFNENFFGRPIVREQKGRTKKAKAYHAYRGTSEASKEVAKALNKLTGGTEFDPGLVDLSPDAMDYVVEYLTGGIGRTVNQSVSLIQNATKKKPVPVRKIPIARRFMGEVENYGDESKFYDNIEKVEQKYKQFEAYKKDKEMKKAYEYLKKNKEYIKYKSRLSNLRKRLKTLRELERRLDNESKFEAAKKVRKMRLKIMKNINKDLKR